MKLYLLLLFVPALAYADWTKIPSNEFSVPPPPAGESPAFENDFAVLHHYQDTRTDAECALARSQEHPTFDTLFGANWNGLSAAEQGRAQNLIDRVIKLSEKIYNYQKDIYLRPRPYDTDPSLLPCTKKPGGSKAYPSGHATVGAATGCVLGLLFPAKAKDLVKRGDYVGELRLIGGVHHPSDVDAGRNLGRALCARLQQEPDFQAELK